MSEQQITPPGVALAHLRRERRARWTRALRAAEWLSIATAAAFALSILGNAIVFYSWGQTFLSIASPADVVMSGINLILTSSFMVGGFFAARAAALATKGAVLGWAVFWTLYVVALLGTARLADYASDEIRLWWMTMALGMSVGPWAAMQELRALRPERDRAKWRVNIDNVLQQTGSLVLRGLLLAAFLLYLGVWMYRTSAVGYFSQLTRLQTPPADCAGRVLWAGERAMVVDCGQLPEHAYQIWLGKEDVVLVQDKREWPEPPPPRIAKDFKSWLQKTTTSVSKPLPATGAPGL